MVWRRLLVALLALPLAAFFAFVGWYKAFAPQAELLAYRAWTAHIPWWLGRPVGWSELLGAAALVAGLVPRCWPATRLAAAWLAFTQVVSSIVHLRHAEADTLPHNLVLFIALLAVAILCGRPNPGSPE